MELLFFGSLRGIQKFIDDKAIGPGPYDLDELFPAKAIWEETLAMKADADALAAKADAAGLADDKKVLAEAGKAWAKKYNYLDAKRFLEAALA